MMMISVMMNAMIQFVQPDGLMDIFGHVNKPIYIHACYFVYHDQSKECVYICMSSEWAMDTGFQGCTTYQIQKIYYIPCNSI